MKKEIAKLWVDALRSRKYTQAKHVLHNDDNGFCCLGVLCDLAIKTGAVSISPVIEEENYDGEVVHYDSYHYDGESEELPSVVQEWAGIKTGLGTYRREDKEFSEKEETLAQDNDRGMTFDEIADIIESNVENL